MTNDSYNETQATVQPPVNNTRVLAMCVGIVLGMGGLAYASVPLYQLFCQVTGYGGTTQRVEVTEGIPVLDREMAVHFDANTERGLDWNFRPVTREVKLKVGETMQVSYKATNLSDKPISGTATFNVTPQAAGAYFNKIECFCFTETYVEPGETLDMPVVFFIDPEIVDERELNYVETITLSYTFFETGEEDKTVSTPVETVEQPKSVSTGPLSTDPLSENGGSDNNTL